MVSEIENYLPYAFALIIAVPFLILLRQLVHSFAVLKEKELKLMAAGRLQEGRTQAFERMTLFLERIKPSNLVSRFDSSLAPHEFVFLTEKSISEEFEYNASQQLYISQNTWQNILQSRDKLVKLLHTTLENISEKSTLEEYKTVFLMNYINEREFITETQNGIKKEFLVLSINN